jgi:hypothetical protein
MTRNGSGSAYVVPVEAHLTLLHRLQQRRLRLRRRAVDLVGQQQVGEHRALTEPERHAVGRLLHQLLTDDVAGHQVGGELQAGELHVERRGEALGEQRLGHARHAFQQHVAVDQQRGDGAGEYAFLPDHDLAHFVAHRQHGVERRPGCIVH